MLRHNEKRDMNKEEKYILSHYGKENHFRVPEGYFEAFNAKILQELPMTDKQSAGTVAAKPSAAFIEMSRRSRLIELRRTIISAAAGICVAILTLQGLLKQNSGDHTSHYASTEEVNSDISLSANMDALFDYTMTDADDMYAYMSNAR